MISAMPIVMRVGECGAAGGTHCHTREGRQQGSAGEGGDR
jgi:hypothetical protein